jgi:hypothetical protein
MDVDSVARRVEHPRELLGVGDESALAVSAQARQIAVCVETGSSVGPIRRCRRRLQMRSALIGLA